VSTTTVEFKPGSKVESVYNALAANVRRWTTVATLTEAGGHRFGSSIHDLRLKGFEIKTRKNDESGETEYKLVRKSSSGRATNPTYQSGYYNSFGW
jgi:hypothetical protein